MTHERALTRANVNHSNRAPTRALVPVANLQLPGCASSGRRRRILTFLRLARAATAMQLLDTGKPRASEGEKIAELFRYITECGRRCTQSIITARTLARNRRRRPTGSLDELTRLHETRSHSSS